jgi:predicted HNH restriction endonuclease
VQVHHIRKLTELDKSGTPRPTWMEIMVKRRRKTLVVCAACHDHIHIEQKTTTHAA